MKSAVVTGASSGIGEATARRLGEAGWQLLLVARREERLRRLAGSLGAASVLAIDLTQEDAPAAIAGWVEQEFGRLDLLVNNAGAAWPAEFGDPELGGYENVRRTMAINFDALVRVTETLLPILRRSAPSAVVNVSSVAGRGAVAKSNAYNASKFAVAGWSEALRFEERGHGVHVGLVMPGWIATEGFPQADLLARRATRWMVSTADKAAEAIVDAGPGGKPERYVPRAWAAFNPLRALAPRLWFRLGRRMRRY